MKLALAVACECGRRHLAHDHGKGDFPDTVTCRVHGEVSTASGVIVHIDDHGNIVESVRGPQ